MLALYYYMKHLIYEDKPPMDIWLWLILFLPSVLILASGFVIMNQDNMPGAIAMFCTAFWIWVALYVLVIPAKYSIFNDRISIISRSMLAWDVPFGTINAVRTGARAAISINLQTRMSQESMVEIVRGGKMSIIISPGDAQEFIKNYQKAYNEWQRFPVR